MIEKDDEQQKIKKTTPSRSSSLVAEVRSRMKELGLETSNLTAFFGSRTQVSLFLSGKRAVSMPIARALHKHLGIPAEVLLSEPEGGLDSPQAEIEWDRFPLKAMRQLGWVDDTPPKAGHAEAVMRKLIGRAGASGAIDAALYRKNDCARANAKMDLYAIQAWCWQVMATANESRPKANYEPGSVTLDFLKQIARLSVYKDGPQRAKTVLAAQGIPLAIVRHLPKTYLDGAALWLSDGRPVIGLTLRYDRLDNFWFCLLHELAHVGRHMDQAGGAFIDDLTLRKVDAGEEDPKEKEADEWAEAAVIPRMDWEASAVRRQPTPIAVLNLAAERQIHPAIIAGRVRHERKNYRLLSQFVGTGEVRKQFDEPRTE